MCEEREGRKGLRTNREVIRGVGSKCFILPKSKACTANKEVTVSPACL